MQAHAWFDITPVVARLPEAADRVAYAKILTWALYLYPGSRPSPGQARDEFLAWGRAAWELAYLAEHPGATDVPVRGQPGPPT